MIVVFPLLTDQSVSQNIIPGICKALEKFIIIYELDAISKLTGKKILKLGGEIAISTAANVATTAASTALVAAKTKRENENLELQLEVQVPPPGQRPLTKDEVKEYLELKKKAEARNLEQEEEEKLKELEKQQQDRFKFGVEVNQALKNLGTVKVDTPMDATLSVEPTYISVLTSSGTQIIGIKVIPFPLKVKGNYSVAKLLTVESSFKLLDAIIFKYSRAIFRKFWAICRGIRVIPFIRNRVVSGDPMRDMILATTFHKRFVFCLLNYADLSDDFIKNAGGIRKLHEVGWNSFVLADDVNKRAIFCMKEFHGLCSSTPYAFLYSSLGNEHSKIYDKLEDVKKTASPFFKMKVSDKRVFGESENKNVNSYIFKKEIK